MNIMNRTCHACVALALAGLVFGTSGCRKAAPKPEIAVPVIAAEVLVRDQPIFAENIGQTFGAQDVEIRARVPAFWKP